MAWESRSRTATRYLTVSTRKDGRVCREYIGSMNDPAIAILGRSDRLRLANGVGDREYQEQETDAYENANTAILSYQRQLNAVLELWWRINRIRTDRNGKWVPAMRVHWPDGTADQTQQMTREEFDELLKRVEIGNYEALLELRSLLNQDRETWRPFGDLTEHVKRAFLALIAKDNVILRESLEIRARELAVQLRGDDGSPIKNLLIDAVVLSWIDYHYCLSISSESSPKVTQADRLEKRVARAQQRYLDTLDALARFNGLSKAEQRS